MVDDEIFALLSEEDLRLILRHDVARRAYEIYERRGGAPGRDLEDWLQAERELRA
ncbi:MAG TPA: DUF2934 domain-containing protein [Planctomycetota bacterium]